jgi:hypothetical protein
MRRLVTMWPPAPAQAGAKALVSATAARVRRRRSNSRSDMLALAWAIGAWLLIETVQHTSLYRGETVLVRRLPTPLVTTLIAAEACIAVPLTMLFVRSMLP